MIVQLVMEEKLISNAMPAQPTVTHAQLMPMMFSCVTPVPTATSKTANSAPHAPPTAPPVNKPMAT